MPLQLHQVLPTLQASASTSTTVQQQQSGITMQEDYYHTASTSPFQSGGGIVGLSGVGGGEVTDILIPQSVISTPSSSSGGNLQLNDEIIRHQNDEYDSDDELRREDISFPVDGGKNYLTFIVRYIFN